MNSNNLVRLYNVILHSFMYIFILKGLYNRSIIKVVHIINKIYLKLDLKVIIYFILNKFNKKSKK
jgi:hypothetical protein